MSRIPPLIVFGAFETGLGIARSLGQAGMKVYCLDHKKDIAFYSRYVKKKVVPHPLTDEKNFIISLLQFRDQFETNPIVFFSSDDFLTSFSKNRGILSEYFDFNILEPNTLSIVEDKYKLYEFCTNNDVKVPKTFKVNDLKELNSAILEEIKYPVFLKGLNVNLWRSKIHGSKKGFKVDDEMVLLRVGSEIVQKEVPFLIQEIIEGPDTNHFKYCGYFSKDGELLAEFTLKKVRQYPIHFGVGAVVESIKDPRIINIGRDLCKKLKVTGVISAEFKFDDRDEQIKLIEINARYWQQNYLATACGVNFPSIQVNDLAFAKHEFIGDFSPGIKWVNRYMDFSSFMAYRKEGSLSFCKWRRSLKGSKVYPDFTIDDPFPAFYEIDFGLKIVRLPVFLFRRLFGT